MGEFLDSDGNHIGAPEAAVSVAGECPDASGGGITPTEDALIALRRIPAVNTDDIEYLANPALRMTDGQVMGEGHLHIILKT